MGIPSWLLGCSPGARNSLFIGCRLSICTCYFGLESCSNAICNWFARFCGYRSSVTTCECCSHCPESDHLSSYSHSIPTFFIVVVYRHLGLSNLLFDMGITGVGVPAGRLPLSPIHDKCGDDKKIPRCVAPVTAMG
jgi:hypothetical protein